MKKVFTGLLLLCFASAAHAATPSISNVAGTVATGQTLTITGSGLSSENTANWRMPQAQGGFEDMANGTRVSNTDPSTNWAYGGGTAPLAYYDNTEKVLGNQSLRLDLSSSAIYQYNGNNRIDGPAVYRAWNYDSNPMYFRWYVKYDANYPWPTQDNKLAIIGATYVQPDKWGSKLSTWVMDNGASGNTHAVPASLYGGYPPSGYWYCLELKKTPSTSEVWLDGVSLGTDSWASNEISTWFQIGMINGDSFSFSGTSHIWLDGIMSSTSRIYPAATVEISNNPTYGQGTIKQQHVKYISDGSIQFYADLSGLGSGPYYLWVTNNGQTRNVAYNLSGGSSTGSTATGSTSTTGGTTSGGTTTPTATIPSGTVIFQENFADANIASRGWYDNTNVAISTTEKASGSASSAAFNFAAGGITPTTGGSMRKQFAETDSIYISYWEKYSTNWMEQAGGYGHHEIYLLTNLDGAYSNLASTHTTAYLENWGAASQAVSLTPHVTFQDGLNIDQSNINVNLTSITENRATNGCNGLLDTFTTQCYNAGNGTYWNGKFLSGGNGAFGIGQWHKVEAYIKMNSIVGGKGVADGVVTYWLDGQQMFSSNNVLIRTGKNATMKFNQFVIGPFLGNGAPANQTFWLDDLVVATGRPGTATATAPGKPANLKVTAIK